MNSDGSAMGCTNFAGYRDMLAGFAMCLWQGLVPLAVWFAECLLTKSSKEERTCLTSK